MKIFLDFGHGTAHGAKDPGAVSLHFPAMTEAEVLYPVGLLAGYMLQRNGHDIMFSRHLDGDVSLRERAAKANGWGADVVVSIHCNAAEDFRAGGYEVLHFGSEGGEKLAQGLLGAFSSFVDRGELPKLQNRGLKVRPELAILRLTAAPAAMVELPFLSNPEERRILADPWHQIAFARAIVAGIQTYAAGR